MARCLDGSYPGYYIKRGDPKRWVIHFEGGGWCFTLADCVHRSTTQLGSSNNWPKLGPLSMDGGAHGIFSPSATENPYFFNWTMIYIGYCDGGSYSGARAKPVVVNEGAAKSTTLYFRGNYIRTAIFDELLSPTVGMNKANLVVLSGTSAGGLGVYLQLDNVRQMVKSQSKAEGGVHVLGLPGAGFFLDHRTWQNKPSLTPQYQNVAAFQNVTTNSDCQAHYKGTKSTWKCFMAQYVLPFIKTEMFVLNSLTDAYQMTAILKLEQTCWNNLTTCNPQETAAIKRYHGEMLNGLAPFLNNKQKYTGAFLDSCCIHAQSEEDPPWAAAAVEGQTMRDTVAVWVKHWDTHADDDDAQKQKPVVVDCVWPCNKCGFIGGNMACKWA